MLKITVVLAVLGALALADKPPIGLLPHHFTGQPGYDTFGKDIAEQPIYGGPHHDIGISHGGGVGVAGGGGYGGGGYGGGGYGHSYGYAQPQVSYHTAYVPIYHDDDYDEGGGGKGKGYLKGLDKQLKGYYESFKKFVSDYWDVNTYEDEAVYAPAYSYAAPVQPYVAPPPTSYGAPASSYGAPPIDSYGAPPASYAPAPSYQTVHVPAIIHEEEEESFGKKLQKSWQKAQQELKSWEEKAKSTLKGLFSYDDYDYEEYIEFPAVGYPQAPAASYGAPAVPASYGAPATSYATAHVPVIHTSGGGGGYSGGKGKGGGSSKGKGGGGGFFGGGKGKGKGGGGSYRSRPVIQVPVPVPTYHAPPPAYAPPPAPSYGAPAVASYSPPAVASYSPPVQSYAPPAPSYGPPKAHSIVHAPEVHQVADVHHVPEVHLGGHDIGHDIGGHVGTSSYAS